MYKRQTLDSLIKPGSLSALTATAEKIFRKNEKLTPKQSLADNYFFEKNTFSLPRNFTITGQGLKFLYNPYEIKPYAAGTTDLLVPFEQIKDILKHNPVLPALK
nr:RsiV family protein [Pedobacter sp. ASV19]